ncbi:sulfatase family protein [Sinomicrobium weinanense]|uniref:Sulfatase n=1 Tax=Sinomicrobium weinanense TaxID=2842200 RepID=A0A926JTC2_9FLAO|nr:sulfatase [Sinomicrobium weinanense]MBC9796893.1 sulfatase [Sinomicrobium weinanense]MBU3124201.1 sulfatase [Sinomicrobium weinanense]
MIKAVLLLILAGLSCLSCKKTKTAEKQSLEDQSTKPNILFILSDDHTSQAWGIYGGLLRDYVKNDNIKRLAGEGAVLDNAFCTNSICSPSRASILTGQYSHINQVYTLREPLPKGHPNIAKELTANGYQTAIIGKWHLDRQPEGFGYFNVLPGQGRYWDPIFKTKDTWTDGADGSKGKIYKGFSTDIIADLTIEHLQERDTTKPFFMLCSFKATHEPFDYPERYNSLYEDVEIPEPASLFDFGKGEGGRTFKGQKLENLAARWEEATRDPENFWTDYPGLPYPLDGLDSIQLRKKIYQKFVKDFMRSGAAIDDNIGKLLNYLEAEGLADNTIVIYTADQGYFLGEHGFFDKRLIYEESLRMPFVIRYPKEIKGGARIDDMILNIDFAALLADYAGMKKPDFIQGRSFRENLKGNTPEDWRDAMYYRYWLHHPDRPAHFGIRNERYKLAFFYGQGLDKYGSSEESTPPQWEFYDLEKDPRELHNAINDPQYAAVIAKMKNEMKKLREEYRDNDADAPVMQPILEELR